jgi:glutamate racemase
MTQNDHSDNGRPLGILDSGVGGLSTLRYIRQQLPQENLLYAADQAHVPYGPRSLAEIRHLTEQLVHFLLGRQVKLIVVACNTASAAALTHLRETFPDTPFVGMEPAVKPGAAQTRNGKVGVLATSGTFSSERYAHLTARFAQGVTVYEDPCRGLVELIEAGETAGTATEQLLRGCLAPMLAAGVDTIVLGCTHYPFVLPLIEKIVGPNVTIIDPSPAVARQTERVLQGYDLLTTAGQAGTTELFTTGDSDQLARLAGQLLGGTWRATAVPR